MTRAAAKPDLTFVTLIHQSLRADAARLATATASWALATGRTGYRASRRSSATTANSSSCTTATRTNCSSPP
jgi:hypothetical protein